jgi:hypothetical protein
VYESVSVAYFGATDRPVRCWNSPTRGTTHSWS